MLNMSNIKINKNHGGKEFTSKFQFVGKVSPVQRKDESDSWYNVEFYDNTTTRTNRDRKVVQFQLETAPFNRLKIESAGMKMDRAYLYSMKARKSHPIEWDERFNKSLYPDDTYFLIDTDWDKTIKFGEMIKDEMWVDVKGHYEFSSFTTDDGERIDMVKRIIDNLTPLKNGLLEVTGLGAEETIRVHGSKEGDNFLGQGKADKEGKASIQIGWLEKEGKIYVCKVQADKSETARTEIPYNETKLETGQFTVTNGLTTSPVRVNGKGREYKYVDYVMDFRDENFKEINSFEMQIGIRSTYQNEETKDVDVKAVFLDYGKERSTVNDVDLVVYYKEPAEGKKSLSEAFEVLNNLDIMTVQGVDNNRATKTLVEVEEVESDNPFEDVEDKITSYEEASTGTQKGLEITGYVVGSYTREGLTEEDIGIVANEDDPFSAVEIDSSDLPF